MFNSTTATLGTVFRALPIATSPNGTDISWNEGLGESKRDRQVETQMFTRYLIRRNWSSIQRTSRFTLRWFSSFEGVTDAKIWADHLHPFEIRHVGFTFCQTHFHSDTDRPNHCRSWAAVCIAPAVAAVALQLSMLHLRHSRYRLNCHRLDTTFI